MNFYCIGINYETTPFNLRAAAYRLRRGIAETAWKVNHQAAVLFTCNRIEIYGVDTDGFSALRTILSLRNRFPEFFESAYMKQHDNEVIYHALRLASGLESQLVGEQQIINQIYSWINQDLFPKVLKSLWVEVLRAAQDIRATSGLSEYGKDITTLIYEDLNHYLGVSSSKVITVIGTGKIAQLFAENRPSGFNLHFVSRKKHSRARQLAKKSGGKAILLDELESVFPITDALISATASPHYILGRGRLKRHKKPFYIYDLAIPQDIEPEVDNMPSVILQNLDSLQQLFQRHNQLLGNHIQRADFLIKQIAGAVKEKIYGYTYQGRNQTQFAGIDSS